MPAYEMKRLQEAFERLKLLSSEISSLAVRVNVEHCSDEELVKAAVYCEMAGDVRQVVNRYRTDFDELRESPADKIGKWVDWACSGLKGGAQ